MFIVINIMTNEVVKRDLADETAALKYLVAHKGEPLEYQYRAGRKKKGKK